jgi:cytochrome b subunit of formate dehydrogenase
VNHVQVPDTCGACHEEIAASYRVSVHGQALSHGVREAPVCTDCHGEHRILSPSEAGSPVFVTNVPKMTCGRCHGDIRLAQKFGLPLEKVPAYEASYHGLAIRSGVTTVAHCGSCHGVHDIQPSSDPRSHVHAENLAQTCGKCHPGAGDTFAIGTVHVLATDSRHAAIYYVRAFYLWLIYLAVGAMVLHNLADFYRKLRTPLPRPPQSGLAARERMPLGFRLAHGALAVSFLVLVLTGFALTYPESWWARPLLRWEGSFGLRGWLHRSAAVVMMAAFFFHFVHLVLSRRARRRIAGMRPTWEDWKEFKERLRYFVGSRPDPPRTGPLGYPEKIEYLSLIWGTGIMVVTGLLLWFETAVLRWLPSWVADVATVVHFYEAVLAGLAILVWHLYFVIFDPVVYPMDTAWLTGRSPDARIHERRGE